MTDERDLLVAVLANPAEDTPRLMYADWLEEHEQQDRAEFIRLQCELARLPDYATVIGHIVEHDLTPKPVSITALVSRGSVKLQRPHTLWHQNRDDSWYCASGLVVYREEEFDSGRVRVTFFQTDAPDEFVQKRRELQNRIQSLWDIGTNAGGFLETPAHWGAPYWHRGFIRDLELTANDWQCHSDVIRKEHPVTRVTLTTWPGDVYSWQFAAIDQTDPSKGQTSGRWPGIEFKLPQSEAFPQLNLEASHLHTNLLVSPELLADSANNVFGG